MLGGQQQFQTGDNGGKGKPMGLNAPSMTGAILPEITGSAEPPGLPRSPGHSGENGSMEPAVAMRQDGQTGAHMSAGPPGLLGENGSMLPAGPPGTKGPMRPPGPIAMGRNGPLGTDGKALRHLTETDPMMEPSGKAGVPGPPGKRRPVGPPELPGRPNSQNLTGPGERHQIPIRGKQNPTYSTNDGDPDWSATISRTEELSVLYTRNNPASGIDSSSVPQDEMHNNPTYSVNDGDPYRSGVLLRPEKLSALYTGNNPASGTDFSSIPQDEMPSFGTKEESLHHMDTDHQDTDTGQESQVRPHNTTLNANAKRTTDTYERLVKDNSHVDVSDNIEPYAVTYIVGDEPNRGEASSTVPGTITDSDISVNPLAGSPGSTFGGNCTSNGTSDITGDNGPGIPQNRRKVRPVGHNPPDMTEPSRKTGPILPGDSGSNGTLGQSGPPGHLEEMRSMGKDDQPGVPLSAGSTYPNPVEQLERPQTNSWGKSVSCRGDFAGFRGICYKVFRMKQSFSEAAATCGENGGTLAMPRDAQINDFLISLYIKPGYRYPLSPLWFGLHDRRVEGTFEWVDGFLKLNELANLLAYPQNIIFDKSQESGRLPTD
ncbi:collagen alpha-1(XIX) chain-like [Branchiostoma lanceolatum]|uniref:collagen alpha-1(XIX) chain-like n=1 Tax=Branchiostoma lanceolatum TaxID=7740 RepID=UPI0034551932